MACDRYAGFIFALHIVSVASKCGSSSMASKCGPSADFNSSEDEGLFIASQQAEKLTPKSADQLQLDVGTTSASCSTTTSAPHYSDVSDDEFDINFERLYSPHCESEIIANTTKDQPVRTKRCVTWASRLFEQWRIQRNIRITRRLVTDKSLSIIPYRLESMNHDELNYCVSRFIYEVKKLDGSDFPPKTVRQLVLLLQMFLDGHGNCVKFLADPIFKEIQNSVDNLMKERAEKGLGLHTKQAQVISFEQEEILWQKGILGSNDAYTLLHTMVYLNGLNFALRSGDEHRSLSTSQLSIGTNSNGRYLEYTEKISKNNRRGLKDAKVPRKISKAYESKECPERCIVSLYLKYIGLCPEADGDAPFYLQPLKKPKDGKWFGLLPVGRNPLNGIVGNMCREAGFEGMFNLF